jgi:ATP-dependent Zn protease
LTKSPLRTLAFALLAVVLCVFALQMLPSGGAGAGPKQFDVQQLTQAVNSGEVTKASWQDNVLKGDLKDGTQFVMNVPEISSAGSLPTQDLLRGANVKLKIANSPTASMPLALLAALTMPLLIIIAIYFLVLRPANRGGSGGQGRIAELERALGQAHLEIQALREALSAKTMEGLSS